MRLFPRLSLRKALPLIAAALVLGAFTSTAHAQGGCDDCINGQFGSSVSLGPFTVGHTSTASFTFALPSAATIESISFDPGPSGAQEFQFVSIFSPCNIGTSSSPANAPCDVSFTVTPLYPGTRSAAMRVVTSSGPSTGYTIGISFIANGPLAAFTPGYISSIKLPAAHADQPNELAADNHGNVFYADPDHNTIYAVSLATSKATVYAGNGASGDSGAAIGKVVALTVAPSGDLYFIGDGPTSSTWAVRRIAYEDSATITTVGTLSKSMYVTPGIALDARENLIVSDPVNSRLMSLQLGSTTWATCASVSSPGALTFDSSNHLYIVSGYQVLKSAEANGTCSTPSVYAGSGVDGYSGDNGPATSAEISAIPALATDAAGNLYIADAGNSRIRIVSPTGTISTLVGTGTPGDTGDGGPASAAELQTVSGIALDPIGNLYIADRVDVVLRAVNTAQPTLTFAPTVEGTTTALPLGVVNLGNQTLQITSVPTFTKPAYTADASSTCPTASSGLPASLAPTATCNYLIDFTPTTANTIKSQLSVTASDSASPHLASLTGTGLATQATLTVSPGTYDFGTVTDGTSSAPLQVTITNSTSDPAIFTNITLSNANNYSLSNSCPATLPGNSSCSVFITFAPQGKSTYTATLTVKSNALNSPQTATVTGTGAK